MKIKLQVARLQLLVLVITHSGNGSVALGNVNNADAKAAVAVGNL